MEFALLDGLRVTADGVDLTPSRPKQRTLLAYLLLHTGEVVSTDDLVDALWGERPPDTALTALHGRIHRHLGDRLDTAVDLSRAARNLAFADKADIAVRLISSFQVMRGEIGVRRSRVAEMNEQTLTTVRRQLGEAAFAEALAARPGADDRRGRRARHRGPRRRWNELPTLTRGRSSRQRRAYHAPVTLASNDFVQVHVSIGGSSSAADGRG